MQAQISLLLLLGFHLSMISALPCDLSNQFCILAWNQQCPDEELNTINLEGTTYSFRNYDVLAFGDVDVSTNGFIQGRAIIEGDFQAGDNVTIGGGITISNGDISLPYSLVVGGDAQWSSGELYPTSSSEMDEEGAWIAGNFITTPELASRRTGGPCSTPNCLDSYFQSALSFWIESSNRMYSQVFNAQVSFDSDQATVTCLSTTATIYFIFINGDSLPAIQSWNIEPSCSSSAMFVMNVIGSTDISISGVAFKYGYGIIYNVIGSGRTITTTTDIYGYIVNVQGRVVQSSGTIYGQIVTSYLSANAIGRFTCPSDLPDSSTSSSSSTSVIVTTTTGGSTTDNNGGSTSFCPFVDDESSSCFDGFLIYDGISYSLNYYHVISFGDVVGSNGDVQGRLAARGLVTFDDQFSVGDKIVTSSDSNNETDRYVPFSLIAGSLSWAGGNLFPDGLSSSAKEDIYVANGDTTNIVSYLSIRVAYSCEDPSCLDDAFDSALQCYLNTQETLSNQASNVDYANIDSQLLFTCSETASRYYITIPAGSLSNSSYYGLRNCSSDAEWVITVHSNDEDVYLKGDSFPADPKKVLYNIIGSGRTIFSTTEVNGAILSPQNTLHQESGVINGKVIVGAISSLRQINKPSCPIINEDNESPQSPPQSSSDDFSGDACYSSPTWIIIFMIATLLVVKY